MQARDKGVGVEDGAIHVRSLAGPQRVSAVAAGLIEQFSGLVRGDVVELRRVLGDEAIAPGAKVFSVGEHIGQAKFAANCTGDVGRATRPLG